MAVASASSSITWRCEFVSAGNTIHNSATQAAHNTFALTSPYVHRSCAVAAQVTAQVNDLTCTRHHVHSRHFQYTLLAHPAQHLHSTCTAPAHTKPAGCLQPCAQHALCTGPAINKPSPPTIPLDSPSDQSQPRPFPRPTLLCPMPSSRRMTPLPSRCPPQSTGTLRPTATTAAGTCACLLLHTTSGHALLASSGQGIVVPGHQIVVHGYERSKTLRRHATCCRFCFATFEEIDHTQALKDMSPQLKVGQRCTGIMELLGLPVCVLAAA